MTATQAKYPRLMSLPDCKIELSAQLSPQSAEELEAWMRETGRSIAERSLMEWANWHQRRDELVRSALEAGISKHRVHALTGIARTTIDRIAAGRPD